MTRPTPGGLAMVAPVVLVADMVWSQPSAPAVWAVLWVAGCCGVLDPFIRPPVWLLRASWCLVRVWTRRGLWRLSLLRSGGGND